MIYQIHLRTRDGKTLATINDVELQDDASDVILWGGKYFAYRDMKLEHGAIHIFYYQIKITELPNA